MSDVLLVNADSYRIPLKDGSVDMIVTDPPYNLGKKYGDEVNDSRPWPEYWEWFANIFEQAYQILNCGYFYMSHSDKGIYDAKPILEKIGFRYIQTLIWWGRNGYSPQLSRDSWSYRHEPILFMAKGSPDHLIAGQTGIWYTSVIEAARPQSNFKEGRHHPTQKPVKLYNTLISRTPGTTVFDPFMGVGSSGVAAIKAGRNYIGIELVSKYFDVAKKRISAAQSQLNLFTPKPQQADLPLFKEAQSD